MTIQSVQFTGLASQKERLRLLIDANIKAVIDHGHFIMGPEVGQLESELATFCGAKHTISCANGTDALQIVMMAFGIGKGDAVLVPSFTYTASAEVIMILGAEPIFVDVCPDSFNISVADLPRALEEARNRKLVPKAIMGVDLFGLPADWTAINDFAQKNGMFAIADSAQSFGAKVADGRLVGTLAEVTTTSFFPAKPLGCYGDGGAIFTDNDDLAAIMRSIRTHGQGTAKYETVRVGMNSRLDTLQAAILLAKLSVFQEEITARNALAKRYEQELSPFVATPKAPANVRSAWAQYTLKISGRDKIAAALSEKGVPTSVYYPKPMHEQQAYQQYAHNVESLSVSKALSETVLSLPMNPYASAEEAAHVIESVKKTISCFHASDI
jgi:dTDP-4-amino-4,6-dideoxygalactose transaminase